MADDGQLRLGVDPVPDPSRWEVREGDCVALMRAMEPGSVDSIVTDPPAGISFMQRSWDSDKGGRDQWIAWMAGVARECLRVIKPGGHALVWALPRTSHWTATAWEDAGWEVREKIAHVFGSGFPKSLSVSKASQRVVHSRYENKTCHCLEESKDRAVDVGCGCNAGAEAGCGDRSSAVVQRGGGERAAPRVGDCVVSESPCSSIDELCELRTGDSSEAQGTSTVKTPVLFSGVRGCGAEDAMHGDAEVRSRVEEPQGGDSETGCGVPNMRQDSRGERECAARPPFEAGSVWREQSTQEPCGPVRLLSSRDGSGDNASAELDSNRSHPRRVMLDDFGGRQNPVARVCSWCGLPDAEWLSSLEQIGTALKPAMEDWWLFRAPLAERTVAANVLAHGVGGINVDACRVEGSWERNSTTRCDIRGGRTVGGGSGELECEPQSAHPQGRWPANLLTDGSEEVRACFPECKTGGPGITKENHNGCTMSGPASNKTRETIGYDDSGSAARFFKQCTDDDPEDAATRLIYVPKASRADRNAGCEGLATVETDLHIDQLGKQQGEVWIDRKDGKGPVAHNRQYLPRQNTHPTVKPTALMRYLVRLVTPPGGLVLDPFCGSGSTGKGALMEGFRFIGLEREAEYVVIARARLAAVPWCGGARACAKKTEEK